MMVNPEQVVFVVVVSCPCGALPALCRVRLVCHCVTHPRAIWVTCTSFDTRVLPPDDVGRMT